MEGQTYRLPALAACLVALALGCESKKEVAQAASADGQALATAIVPPQTKNTVEVAKADGPPIHAAA
jgi:hypothetical protein